ncbi:PHP domain-containing protein [Candidatus Woesearchaeota archaeon]|nr:PHP domain-containing protein [Candidatus Woesearchaeota archaeon]
MLKAELHTHAHVDPKDSGEVSYSIKELIDQAAEFNFEVLAITCHDLVYIDDQVTEYAQRRGIHLIPGVEKTIDGKHVLIYNLSDQQAQLIKTFEDLKSFKKVHPDSLIIAPHPFHYKSTCLKQKVLQYLDLFDAWEYSWFYLAAFNPNKRTAALAQKYHKPVIGSSDVHNLRELGRTYTLIDSKKSTGAICAAIKVGKTTVISKPLPLFEFIGISIRMLYFDTRRKLRKLFG